MTTKFMMPAGQYYIGDLCYVMRSEWNEFCDLTINDRECLDGKFALTDGRSFVTFRTMYGDGVYTDDESRQYGVDAGLIGAIKVDDISEEDKPNIKSGNIVEFERNWYAHSDNGVLFFGDVAINTGDDDEDEDEDYWPEEDYYDEE